MTDDDSLGMSGDDALLCLERHATSKIRRAEDLGFRGPRWAFSGGSAAERRQREPFRRLTTREREGDTPEATQVVINGGKILEVKAAGSAPGTSIEVRQLFSSTSPRARKFLRS